jgi:hypothetical protein
MILFHSTCSNGAKGECKNYELLKRCEFFKILCIRYYLVRNHVKLGVSIRILYCVVDTGYGLGGPLGDCRPALPKG